MNLIMVSMESRLSRVMPAAKTSHLTFPIRTALSWWRLPGGRLGVDLEKIRPKVEWRLPGGTLFSAAEVRALDGYSDETGLKAFFTCWTRKEAFVKALGGGISYGLKGFDVSIDPDEACAALTIRSEEEDASRWLIKKPPRTGNPRRRAGPGPACL